MTGTIENHKYQETFRMTQSEKIDLLFCSLLSALSLVFFQSGNTILSTCVSVLFVVYTLFRPSDDALIYVAFGLSNSAVLAIGGMSVSVCICFVYVILSIIKGSKYPKSLIVTLVVYFLWSLNYYFRFSDFQYGVVFSLKNIFVILFFYGLTQSAVFLRGKNKLLVKSIFYCSTSIAINLLVSYILIGGGRLRVIKNDSNIMAIEAVVMIAIASVLYFGPGQISTIKYGLLSMVMGVCAIVSGSRNGIILLLLVIAITLFCNLRKASKTTALLLIIMLVSSVIILSPIGKNALQLLQYRMDTYNQIGDVSNGRFDFWKQYIEVFNENKVNWLLGFGNYLNMGLSDMAHNGLLEDITCYGIIGFLLLLGSYKTIIDAFRHALQTGKKRLYYYMPVVIILLGTITLRGITNIINMTMLFFALMVIFVEAVERRDC